MQRLLAPLVPLVLLFFLRQLLTPADGHQTGYVAAAQLAVVRFLSERLAGGHVPDDAVGLIFGVVLLLAGVMGFLLHLALEERGFGPYLNGVLCFFGAASADAAFVALAPRAYVADPSVLVMSSSLGAVCALLLAALIKAALLQRFDDFASGARSTEAQRKNGVPARRITAATRRL